jgi:hypothetical protein
MMSKNSISGTAVLELRSDFGLFSKEDEQGERVLVYCDLPFAEDRRELVFRSLIDRKHMPTEDQVGSIYPCSYDLRRQGDPSHFAIIILNDEGKK